MNTFVALDFETANRNLSSVCSIGLVFVENSVVSGSYYRLIKPFPEYYSYFNTQIHGLSKKDTENQSQFPEIWNEIAYKLLENPVIAHNSRFDESCLQKVLAVYGLPKFPNKFFCTCQKSRQVFPQLPNHKLVTVAQHIGFPLTNHHHALADAEACAAIALQVFKD